jgi:nicotinamide riboside kinase
MTPLYTFTGPPSSGKTSIMNGLKNVLQGNWFYIDEVTRHMKRKYNIGINENGSEVDELLMINRHISNAMYPVSKRDENYNGIILNRCILDTYVFARWGHNNGTIPSWILDYASRALMLFKEKYDIIFYPDPHEVVLEDDGVRSKSNKFRDEITQIFESVIIDYEIPVVRLKGTVNERIDEVVEHIHDHINDDKNVNVFSRNFNIPFNIDGSQTFASDVHERILKKHIDPLDMKIQL